MEDVQDLLAEVEAWIEEEQNKEFEKQEIIKEADRIARQSFETGQLPDLFNY